MNNSKNLFWKIFSIGIQFIVTLLITRIIVSKIGNDGNGFYQLSNDFVNYAMVASIALNSMAARYIIVSFYKNNIRKTNKYYNSVLYSDIFLSVVIFFISLILCVYLEKVISIPQELLNDVKLLFLTMFLNFVITVAASVYGVATVVKNRVDLDSKRNAEGNIIKLVVFAVLTYYFEPKIWYIGMATIVANFYVVFRNIKYTRILLPDIVLFKKDFFDRKIIKELVSSGSWNSITKIGSIFLGGMDLLLANQFIDSFAMGVLSISKLIPKYIFSSITSVASVFNPSILIEYAKEDVNSLVKVINKSIRLMSFFSVIVEVIVLVLARDIFVIWLPGQNYDLLYRLSIIAIIGYIALMPLEVLWAVFTAKNKVKISSIYLIIESILVISIVLIGMICIDDIEIKLYLIAGTSSVFELIRAFIFLPVVSAKMLNINKLTFYTPLLQNIVALCISVTLGLLLKKTTNITGLGGLFFYCATLVAFSTVVCYLVLCSKEDRKEILNLLIRKMRKLR